MDPTRSLIEILLRGNSTASMYNLNDGMQGPSAGYASAIDINAAARHLYTSPSTNVPLTINTSSLPNTAPSANQQYILDMGLCTPSTANAATIVAAAAASAARNMAMAVRPFQQEPIPILEAPRRQPVSNNVAFNHIKETVVRAQQRKRQRDFEQQAAAAYQNNQEYNAPSNMVPTPTATSSTTTSGFTAGHENLQRGTKIRRKEDDRAQESIAEGAPGTSSQSLTDSTNRFNNNQQIMGVVRQHEQRNCHYCTIPNIPPAANLNRRDVINTVSQVMAANNPLVPTIPTMQSQTIPPTPTIQSPRPDNVGIIRPSPLVGPLPVIMPFQHQIRMLQEAIMNSHVQHLQQQYRPYPTPGYLYVPNPIAQSLNELVMLGLFQTENLMRERTALDRHYMFAGIGEDIPIGATTNDIDKNTKLVLFEKEKEANEEATEPDRCTVCLSDFESEEEVRLLRCSHIFHPYCIDRWLMYNKKCPVCRMDVDEPTAEDGAAAAVAAAEIPFEQAALHRLI